ncbi:MAG TPA: hypothetical protein VF532_23650 [Candidatus Angelobacter sp.]
MRSIYWLVLLALAAAPAAYAAGGEDEEFDSYKLRFSLFWFNSHPSGTFTSAGRTGLLDLSKDIGFNTYSTFYGKVDLKFTHKNHLYLIATDFDQTKTVVLNRTITFQGQTFNVNSVATGNLSSLFLIPGYQYDFIRRRQFVLGVQVQLDIIDVSGSLRTASQVNNGIPQAAAFSSGSIRAPLPVAGPTVRWYIIPNHGILFVDANVLGMYFFGYGNFVSSQGTVGLRFGRNFAIRGGYQLGSRFDINTKAQRIGVSLSQKGALAGLEISF